MIDLTCIIPFELIFREGNAASLLRYVRISRIPKMLRLIKLLKLLRLQKSSTFSLISWIQTVLSISSDFKWFLIFFCYFVMTTHVVACLWIIAGQMSESVDPIPWTT